MRLAFLALPVASLLALAACNREEPAPAATDETAEAAVETPAPADMAAPLTAQAFADAAAASDMFEIESGKLAQKMGKDAGVKTFADMLVKDHTKSSADLKAAAAKATPAVTPAAKLTAEQQGDLDALKGAGDSFDKVFAMKQAAAHEKALAMLDGYAKGGDAASLKDFAGKTAPVVKAHLDMAKKLPQ